MLAHHSAPVYDVFKFRRFRLNIIGFLKLPLGVNETTLRDVIKGSSINLLAHYLARAERVAAKSAPPIEITPRHVPRVTLEPRAHA